MQNHARVSSFDSFKMFSPKLPKLSECCTCKYVISHTKWNPSGVSAEAPAFEILNRMTFWWIHYSGWVCTFRHADLVIKMPGGNVHSVNISFTYHVAATNALNVISQLSIWYSACSWWHWQHVSSSWNVLWSAEELSALFERIKSVRSLLHAGAYGKHPKQRL